MILCIVPHLAIQRLETEFPDMQTDFVESRATLRKVVDELIDDHAASVSANGTSPSITTTHPAEERITVSQPLANTSGGNEDYMQNGHSVENENESSVPSKQVNDPHIIRKGVKPGSFIDLLVRGSMKGTGESFTANQKAQQVSLLPYISLSCQCACA